MSQDWRIETDSTDYFGAQKKRLATDERRPAIRKASDLVGPGIGSEAVRLTDYNDVLATFNGYYSSEPGALSAPNSADPFTGSVVGDPALGGVQEFTSLVSGNKYTRVFRRNPSDTSSVSFASWTSPELVPASMFTYLPANTALPEDVDTYLTMPEMAFVGDPDTYSRSTNQIAILRPGVYTGYFWMRLTEAAYIENIVMEFPNGYGQTEDFVLNQYGYWGTRQPLNFFTVLDTGFVRFRAKQNEVAAPATATLEFRRLQLTRIGDAVW